MIAVVTHEDKVYSSKCFTVVSLLFFLINSWSSVVASVVLTQLCNLHLDFLLICFLFVVKYPQISSSPNNSGSLN